jgi:hypothetical protein
MSPHYRDTLDYETGVRIVVDFTVRRRGAKAAAESFHACTLGEGMRAAVVEVRANCQEMIYAWRAT